MAQPGWYPDPFGTGSLRWWDGQNWTQHLNPEPARPAAQWIPPQPRRVIEAIVRGVLLQADDQAVAYGDASLAWQHVEWVSYWAARLPSGETQWIFQVGRHPFHGGPRVEVVIEPAWVLGSAADDGVDGEQVWLRLVELCRSRVEPRLVAELAGRVRAGDSIDVAQGLTVHPGGVRGSRVSLSWSTISGATMENGRVWIQQSSGSAPVLYVPQQNPNAVLIPDLLARLRQ